MWYFSTGTILLTLVYIGHTHLATRVEDKKVLETNDIQTLLGSIVLSIMPNLFDNWFFI